MKPFATLILGVAFLIAVNAYTSNSHNNNYNDKIKYKYQYAASFVCGLVEDSDASLINGEYSTTIQIHNPEEKSKANIRKKIALTFPADSKQNPQAQAPGTVSQFLRQTLEADDAIQVDCGEIFGTDRRGGSEFVDDHNGKGWNKQKYVQGYLVIESDVSIDVDRTTTAGNTVEQEESHSNNNGKKGGHNNNGKKGGQQGGKSGINPDTGYPYENPYTNGLPGEYGKGGKGYQGGKQEQGKGYQGGKQEQGKGYQGGKQEQGKSGINPDTGYPYENPYTNGLPGEYGKGGKGYGKGYEGKGYENTKGYGYPYDVKKMEKRDVTSKKTVQHKNTGKGKDPEWVQMVASIDIEAVRERALKK